MAPSMQPIDAGLDAYAGLRRVLEVGIRLAPTRPTAVAASKALAAFLDSAGVPVRIAGLAADDSRVLITIAVSLGAVDDIKTAAPESRAALALVQRIVDELAGYDPAFATLPQPSSAEARLAAHVMQHPDRMPMAVAVSHLAGIG